MQRCVEQMCSWAHMNQLRLSFMKTTYSSNCDSYWVNSLDSSAQTFFRNDGTFKIQELIYGSSIFKIISHWHIWRTVQMRPFVTSHGCLVCYHTLKSSILCCCGFVRIRLCSTTTARHWRKTCALVVTEREYVPAIKYAYTRWYCAACLGYLWEWEPEPYQIAMHHFPCFLLFLVTFPALACAIAAD